MSKEIKPLRLRMGVDAPEPTAMEVSRRVEVLKATVRHYVPEVVQAIDAASESGSGTAEEPITVAFHQDAFASGYDYDEYIILGMIIKYAGVYGVRLIIGGRNHETF